MTTPESGMFAQLQHWQAVHQMLPPEDLFPHHSKYYPFFLRLYRKTGRLYRKLPPRKNGENAFIHPLNIIYTLRRAGVTDELTLCTGLLHDYIEEEVDLYKKRHQISDSPGGMRKLEGFECRAFARLEDELQSLSKECRLPQRTAKSIIQALHLLTRHKREFYYKYISALFAFRNREIQERAIQVKLADRMHNILCIECFNERERIYQCFKNLFILNNAKRYIITHYGTRIYPIEKIPPTKRLFIKCAKATYDAFLSLCYLSGRTGTVAVHSLLQLAFKKFALMQSGLEKVTELKSREYHPMRLYHGVVRKYDARLHHEWEEFRQRMQQDLDYCRKFFSSYRFSEKQLQSIVDYKDAYALKEVVAQLLYNTRYVIHRFLVRELSAKGRIKRA